MSWTSTEISVCQSSVSLKFLSLRNLAPHYNSWTSKEILALQKLYCYFEGFYLLGILLRTWDMVVLEESSLVLSFSKNILSHLKMSSGLLECFVIVWFCIFCLPNILQRFLERFSYFHLILAQILHLLIVYALLGVISLANFQSLV